MNLVLSAYHYRAVPWFVLTAESSCYYPEYRVALILAVESSTTLLYARMDEFRF